ncbi:MAG TPA: hypothetical protein PLS53_13065 [Thermoanaerobaculaceae bacterium]|nr:hypothetical protein [Thermoanaerobaculaceae bacterium]HPS79081.1 hypothetical protein [Thermoanaerobaculaceae bacterium]
MVNAQPVTRQETEMPEAVLRRLRESTQRWLQQERLRPHLTSGLIEVDACLGGGWPLGKVAELVGPRSCGRATVATATVAAATGRGEVVAWIDLSDALDPPSLARAGVDLERVLWVRPATHEQAVRASELVLEAGGFTAVVLDLVPIRRERCARGSGVAGKHPGPPDGLGSGVRGPGSSWEEGSRFSALDSRTGGRGKAALALRLARAVERAGIAALVLVERPWTGSLAGVTVWLERGGARWLGGNRGGPRWLAGLPLRPSLHPAPRVGGLERACG